MHRPGRTAPTVSAACADPPGRSAGSVGGSGYGPPVASLILSVAVVLSVVSLGWQVWTWRRSGAVVRVTARQSFPVYGSVAGDWQIDVTACNVGRGPVQVLG